MINNIPPKQTLSERPGTTDNSANYDTLSHTDTAQQGLVLHDSLPGDANSFPVLKAFQEHLEMERQQARKRLMMLVIFFCSLMTLVVAGFIAAFIFIFGNMARREDRLMDAALHQKQEIPPPPAPLMDRTTQEAASEFKAATLNLQTNLTSQLAAVGSIATSLDSRIAAQNSEMTKLRDALTALQKENATMRTNLPKLALEAARKLPPPATSAQPPPASSSAKPPPPAAPVAHAELTNAVAPIIVTTGTPAAAAGKPLPGYEEAVLTIHSRNNNENIPWRTLAPQ